MRHVEEKGGRVRTQVLRWLTAGAALTSLACAGCSGATQPSTGAVPPAQPSAAQTSSSPSASSTPVAPASSPAPRKKADGTVTKVLVLVVENHSLDQMRSDMPYTASLADRYAYATDYTGIRHPSLPNYISITGGDTFGIADDDPPSSHPVDATSVFGEALKAGKTAGLYADGMPTACATENGGDAYAVKHNPWAYYVSERDACAAGDQPLSALPAAVQAGSLPDVGMVIPNMCHDAHDCSLRGADDWIKGQLQGVLAGPDFRSGHLAVVITADEDDHHSGNKVLTVVVHPSQHGRVVSSPLNHYSLSGLCSDVVGAPRLRNAATAPSMAAAFGLPVG